MGRRRLSQVLLECPSVWQMVQAVRIPPWGLRRMGWLWEELGLGINPERPFPGTTEPREASLAWPGSQMAVLELPPEPALKNTPSPKSLSLYSGPPSPRVTAAHLPRGRGRHSGATGWAWENKSRHISVTGIRALPRRGEWTHTDISPSCINNSWSWRCICADLFE